MFLQKQQRAAADGVEKNTVRIKIIIIINYPEYLK